MEVENEQRDEEVQASAEDFWDRIFREKGPIMRMEPYIVKELLKLIPDGVVMDIYFDV